MSIGRACLFLFLVLAYCTASADVSTTPTVNNGAPVLLPDAAQIEALAESLEDPKQRAELIQSLRALATAQEQLQAERSDIRSAASQTLDEVLRKLDGLTRAVSAQLMALQRLPALLSGTALALAEPETRGRWMKILLEVVSVLGTGFMTAWIMRRLLRGNRRVEPKEMSEGLPPVSRLMGLFGDLMRDLVPIAVFAASAFGVLAALDAEKEVRYLAMILINASLLSRLILTISSFFFAPRNPAARLWQLSDESARYIHSWVKRLTLVGVYGFSALAIAQSLGLSGNAQQSMLRLLGLVILALLLVMIGQNRRDVARAIAGMPRSDSRVHAAKASPLMSVRKSLARVWHLIAGVYLIALFGAWAMRVHEGTWFVLRTTVLSVVTIAVAQLLSRAIEHLFSRGLRLSDDLRTDSPRLKARLHRYFPILARVLKAVTGLFALLIVLDVWGLDALAWLAAGAGRTFASATISVFLIIVAALFVWELGNGAIERHLADSEDDRPRGAARTRTLLTVARNALMVFLLVVVVLMVMSEVGINIAPLLAGAGVVGLAVGFGSQRLVQDVINGAFILLQDLIAVGDVVSLGGKSGVVEALSIRTVRLRDLAGTVHTIPFSTIESVSNLTRDFSFYVFDIGIAYREDIDEVIDLLKRIGEELRADEQIGPLILESVEVFGLDAFGDSAIVIKGRIKTRPIKQWQVGRAFNRLVKRRFDERGIEMPYPHRTLYFGQDKSGGSAPAFVQLYDLHGRATPSPAGMQAAKEQGTVAK